MEIWAPGRDLEIQPLTDFELHMVHLLGGTGVCLLVNHLAAIFTENSHYRGMALLLQTLFFVVDGYSYLKMEKDVLKTPVVFILGVCAISMIIHAMEPGIFTKDKRAQEKKDK